MAGLVFYKLTRRRPSPLTFIFLLAITGALAIMRSQELPDQVPQPPQAPLALEEQTATNPAGCLEPPPLPSLDDYAGPLEKTVGIFARALERKSAVRQVHYKPGLKLCSLGVKDKFWLFFDDSLDPVTFLSAGFDAGIDQATSRDPSLGQGTAGFSLRFASDLADRVSSKFWKEFAYPSVFFEDPRYYPLGQGSTMRRLLHAFEHLIVAHRADGSHMFNYSEWLGTTTAVLMSDAHHPGNDHGIRPTTQRVGNRFAWDIGFDLLREFWPDIARKFKLPFRGVSKQPDRQPDHR